MAQITLNSSGVASNGTLALQSNGTTTAVTIDTAQNMGLGVTPSATWSSAARAIQLGGFNSIFGYTSNVFRLANNAIFTASNETYGASSIGATYYQQYNGAHSWYTAASGTAGNTISFTQAMTLDASGNLGVGTTSPQAYTGFTVLTVDNATNGGIVSIRKNGTVYGNISPTGNNMTIDAVQASAAIAFRTGTSSDERARIDSSGNLLVGALTAGGGTARVYVNGDATNPAFRALANTATTSVYAGVFRHDSTTAGAYIQFVTDSNAETGRIYDLAGTMQYASSSDARLKTNIQPMQNGLQSVLALNPCTFDMRRGEDTFVPSSGLIAQEVHEVYPFIVGVGGDDENTNPWSVDYGKLTPLLVAAIQEQQAIITQLQADVAALKGTA